MNSNLVTVYYNKREIQSI